MPDEKVNEKAEGYMILVCWDEISARLAGTDSTLRLHVKIKFRHGKAG